MTSLARWEPYSGSHFDQIQPRLKAIHAGELGKESIPLNGMVTTLFFGDLPVAIVGGSILLTGVLQVWAFMTNDIKEHPIVFHKAILKLLDWWFKNGQIRRMQMSVRVDFTEGWKWSSLLGFKSEGVMTKYGMDGSDYWLFARVA